MATDNKSDLRSKGYKPIVLFGVNDTTGEIENIKIDNDGKMKVSGHNKGYFATEAALNTAYPTAIDGDYAIVGATDTVWVWDSDTTAWVDSGLGSLVTSVAGKVGAVTLVPSDIGLEDDGLQFIIDGNGFALTATIKGDIVVPFDCIIVSYTVLADQSGSVQVDVWKDTYANFPPTNADSITASAPIKITTATKNRDSTLTGWTKSLTKGDILRFFVDSCTSITRVTIILQVTKS